MSRYSSSSLIHLAFTTSLDYIIFSRPWFTLMLFVQWHAVRARSLGATGNATEPRRAASYTTSVCGSAPHDVGTRTEWPNDAFSDRIRLQAARDRWGSPHCPFLHALLPPSAQMAPLSENLSQSYCQNWGRRPRGTQCAVFTPSLAATMLIASCAEPLEGSNDSPLMFLDRNTENSFLIFGK